MASASTWQLSALRHSSSFSSNRNSFAGLPSPSNLAVPRVTLRYSTAASARRRGNLDRTVSSSSGKRKTKKKENRDDSMGEDDIDEDAFEALFKHLEEDLKNDKSIDDIGDDISEEDFVKLEKEIEEALAEDEDLSDLLKSYEDDSDEEESDVRGEIEEQVEAHGNEAEEEVQEEPKLQLRGWQLRRLASALKKGRRKTSIKKLATEIDLDRAIVLELLRNPPPSLLMMSSVFPEKLEQSVSTAESEPEESLESEPSTTVPSYPEDTSDSAKTPIHVLQSGWTARKRLKKVHVDTLERVYRRSKRPTNAIISSIVQVTNVPRKRIVKWFEEKRAEEGVPNQHQHRTYRRSTSESHPAFSNVGGDSSSEPT